MADATDANTTEVTPEGAVILSAALRERAGIAPGDIVVTEQTERGILIRPLVSRYDHLIEIYTPERQAEFLLSNTMDAADYARAVALVRDMGFDPDTIPHAKPDE